MFRYKREEISSSSQDSLSSSASDSSVSDIVELVDKLELNLHHVQETVIPALQSDLKQLQKKLHRHKSRKHKKKTKEVPTLQNEFKHIPVVSKFGYTKGDRVTINNKLVINDYTVPTKYKTGPVADFTSRFVVISITYKREKKFYTKPVYRESKNIRLA